ncbi:MAG: ATP-dependent DNA helicase RecG [Planctomycetota bacterium]
MASERSITLTTPVGAIPGVRKDHAEKLTRLGVPNVGHLLAHLPHRHEWIRAEAGIADLVPDSIVSVRGEITATRMNGYGRKARFQAVLMDDTGRLDLVFFNQPYLRDRIKPGMRLRVQGKAARYGPGLQMTNARFDVLDAESPEPHTTEGDELRPVYPVTEGITSDQARSIVATVLEVALEQIDDHMPEELRRNRTMPALRDAYRMMHAPESEDEVKAARRRLAYDELLLFQLGVHMKRAHLRQTMKAPPLERTSAVEASIKHHIPFELTGAQARVVNEIAKDLALDVPMNRLVQGDVGSGKTVVALDAMLRAIGHGHQAGLMAPTEILAEQHYLSMSDMLAGSNVSVALLTGNMPAEERTAILRGIADGTIDLVIGTHALIAERVAFRSLAVVVIDEQHRFGVEQRAKLRVKGSADDAGAGEFDTPHVLVMTATPIPRTIGLTLFGDLDISTIDELPPGRTPVKTRTVTSDRRGEVYQWLRSRLEQGEQAYIVVPAIDSGASSSGGEPGSEKVRDLRTVHAELENAELNGLRIAALHGRLKRETREHVMARFRAGSIDALIATTVIEVGVDVPNATTIVIEHADRFGLAQLHQLRGRVGRGSKPGACVLIADPKTTDGIERIEVMCETTDGFRLAERDFEIRGPGDVFGTRQSGVPPFKVADPIRDARLLEIARRDAAAWIALSPNLAGPGDALARRRLLRLHGPWLGLGDVG